MSDGSLFRRGGDQLASVDAALADGGASPSTRRSLLKLAAVGVAGGAAAGPLSAALAPAAALAADSPATVAKTAATAEALAITYLTSVIDNAKRTGHLPNSVITILEAANQAETDHLLALRSLGYHPLTTRFWIPNAFYGTNLGNVAATIEVAETLFVNAYLIGVTVFAKASPTLARYAAEICGVEAEHRALARSLQNKLPNNVGFEGYYHTTMAGIVGQLEKVGVGFGKQGSQPGAFHTYRGTGNATTAIEQNKPH